MRSSQYYISRDNLQNGGLRMARQAARDVLTANKLIAGEWKSVVHNANESELNALDIHLRTKEGYGHLHDMIFAVLHNQKDLEDGQLNNVRWFPEEGRAEMQAVIPAAFFNGLAAKLKEKHITYAGLKHCLESDPHAKYEAGTPGHVASWGSNVPPDDGELAATGTPSPVSEKMRAIEALFNSDNQLDLKAKKEEAIKQMTALIKCIGANVPDDDITVLHATYVKLQAALSGHKDKAKTTNPAFSEKRSLLSANEAPVSLFATAITAERHTLLRSRQGRTRTYQKISDMIATKLADLEFDKFSNAANKNDYKGNDSFSQSGVFSRYHYRRGSLFYSSAAKNSLKGKISGLAKEEQSIAKKVFFR